MALGGQRRVATAEVSAGAAQKWDRALDIGPWISEATCGSVWLWSHSGRHSQDDLGLPLLLETMEILC